MKKYVLATLILFASAVAAIAQPTLTSATNNPQVGDTFYGHIVDTTGKSKGPAGAMVSWNFPLLTEIHLDTTTYLACAATPACDSFTGTNLVSFDNTDYQYGIANATGFSVIGMYNDGSVMHLKKPKQTMFFPMAYNTVHKDSFVMELIGNPDIYIRGFNSSKCDAWGTLVLPSGTYTNVLRVHTITFVKDSIVDGSVSYEDSARSEVYSWYAAGFHSPLLTMRYDEDGGDTFLSEMTYYTKKDKDATTTSNLIADAPAMVYPNPATDVLHIRFNVTAINDVSITISESSGRIVDIIGRDQLKVGTNDINYPLKDLPAGLYVVALNANTNRTFHKIVVSR